MKDFWVRFVSSVTLALLTVAVVWVGVYALLAFMFLVSLIGYYELIRAAGLRTGGKMRNDSNDGDSGGGDGGSGLTEPVNKIGPLELTGLLAVLVYYLAFAYFGDWGWTLLVLLALLIVFLSIYALTFPRYRLSQIAEAFAFFLYGPVMLSCIAPARGMTYGFHIVVLIFISSWVCDVFAYCVGILFGRHKLAPTLSPNKSIEGALAGVVGAAAAGAIYGSLLARYLPAEQELALVFAVICAVGAVIAQMGDLVASAIKRGYDIKDFGRLIPGHGGVIDRFDSVIFTTPVIFALAALMLGNP